MMNRHCLRHVLFLCTALSLLLSPLVQSQAEKNAVDRRAPVGQGLLELWSEGKPALGYYLRPDSDGGDDPDAHPVYSVQTGRELAENPLPDFAFLSLEHHYDAEAARNVLEGLRSGASNSDLSLLVRIPPISEDGEDAARERVREALELGANGVVIPHVLSLDEAQAAVSFFDGFDVWSPKNPTGSVVAMLIVEDPEVFDDLQAIADLPGYSSLVCGIGSLTAALDGDREAAEAINLQVLATAQAAGLPNMTTVNEASIEQRIEQGFLGLLAYGATANDTLLIGRRALEATEPGAEAEPMDRGAYLTAAGNCVSCHTRDGGAPFAGGLEFVTDFGTIYSTNITPDAATGIGSWSLEDFTAAMRQGVSPEGKHYYPVFPYTSYTKVSDEDVAAIFDYLKSLDPVSYTPPENDLGFPYSQRWALGAWKSLYFEEGRFEPDAARSEAWNRGAYLVEGLGHCGECHTPRNALGGRDADLAMTGSSYLERVEGKLSKWSASNLTSAATGLKAWSKEEIADYLSLGFSERAGVFGPMNKVVVNGTSHLSAVDVDAMATYLKALPPAVGNGDSEAATEDVLRTGSIQYDIHCGTCHLPTGMGSGETGPPVLGSPVVLDADPASLINVTLYGAQLPKTSPSKQWEGRTWKRMEAYADKLSDEQVAALLSYMRSAWGHDAGAVTAEQVAAQR
ncbi:MAG: c-type cytochrome [Halieaceae bacterium]|jgi:mono/diheme cytochrome c family protein|nr:c-type cytochrome [Halieaceae bacterium]